MSLIFGIPVINCRNLSKPKPKPPVGTLPNSRNSKYQFKFSEFGNFCFNKL